MVQSQKNALTNNPKYKLWLSKRLKFRHSADITYRTLHKKGRTLPSYSVCALCGTELTQFNISSMTYSLKENAEFLTTGSILNYHIHSDAQVCYRNIQRKEEQNGNLR